MNTREGTMTNDELDPEEKAAFMELERERTPSELLEERVVRALRAEGILESPAARRRRPGWMGAAAAAAAVAIFAGGAAFGHALGSRTTAETLLAVREQDAAQLAQGIQEAGSAYVSALAALSELRVASAGEGGGGAEEAAGGDVLAQGREAAMGSLYAAAFELARLSPGDADVLRILEILAQRRGEARGNDDVVRNVVWF